MKKPEDENVKQVTSTLAHFNVITLTLSVLFWAAWSQRASSLFIQLASYSKAKVNAVAI